MQELAIDNQFGWFAPRRQPSFRKKETKNFEAIIPSQPKVSEYRDSVYYLDSISGLAKNQSLTAEQIAKGQTKTIIEEINALPSKYEISNFEEVKNFLSKNRFLTSSLEAIPNKIYQYFGSDQRLSLDISHEPDFPQSTELWVFILTELSANEALPLLEKFDEEWWLENMDKADYKLNITLKFI